MAVDAPSPRSFSAVFGRVWRGVAAGSAAFRRDTAAGSADAAARVLDACAEDAEVLAAVHSKMKAKAAENEQFAQSIAECAPATTKRSDIPVVLSMLSGATKETTCPLDWPAARLRQHVTEDLFAMPDNDVVLRHAGAVVDDASGDVRSLAGNAERLRLDAIVQWRFAAAAEAAPDDALIEAAGSGHAWSVNRLIALGASVNAVASVELQERLAERRVVLGQVIADAVAAGPALHAAAWGGRVEAVEALLRAGANINWRGTWPKESCVRALHLAVRRGHETVVRLLLARGADGERPGEPSVIRSAAGTGHMAMVRLILAHGAPAAGLIHMAANWGHTEVIKGIMGRTALNINAIDDGVPALLCAATGGHLEVVRLLLERGADPMIKDDGGMTARQFLETHGMNEDGDREIAELLELEELRRSRKRRR
mmetsp:Transcript_62511/g.191206  ORF Transcript_62511/g.191206 Transcript_62511/m.191206 type:complete len:427 (-) Transcript_62511:8-1288(-)